MVTKRINGCSTTAIKEMIPKKMYTQEQESVLKLFNVSYSSYSTYLTSPLQFYHQYIAKSEKTDKGMQVYGDAGNVVHSAIEDYINVGSGNFFQLWKQYKIDDQCGFRGSKLDPQKFRGMYLNACEFIKEINFDIPIKTELKIEKEFLGMKFKGFIDLYTENGDDIILYDWKTNSTHNHETHKKQRLLYSWFIWKIKGIIPTCKWVYLKNMNVVEDQFLIEELMLFEGELQLFKQSILEKGNDISKYDVGQYNNPFNNYYTLCNEERIKRMDSDNLDIVMNIKGNYVFFEGDIPNKLIEGIDYKTRFDLPDKFHMQQAVKKRGGIFNLNDVGTVHLYNKKFKCFPIGLLDKIKNICHEYGEHYKKELMVTVNDCRDVDVMDNTIGSMFARILSGIDLRPYQFEAQDIFMEHKHGIINIATGGGKTYVASEIIRKVDGKTLWICDRKELLQQTKKALEGYLGIRFNQITEGIVETGVHVIATIQSLHSKLPEIQEYLKTVNFVIVDEFHKAAAETYQKVFAKLPNTKYRLGLTATVERDDGKTPILHSLLGDIIHQVTTQDLIEQGYLVKPDIQFIDLEPDIFSDGTYAEDYNENIVECDERNLKIHNQVWYNPGKKHLILCKSVEHGRLLARTFIGAAIVSKHIHGKSGKNRAQIMQDFRDNEFNVLIMTLSIGAEGLDIPDLDVIINASGNKGDVKSIQVLGRVLRCFKDKKTATYIDFVDSGKYTRSHSKARIKAFEKQGHIVKVI